MMTELLFLLLLTTSPHRSGLVLVSINFSFDLFRKLNCFLRTLWVVQFLMNVLLLIWGDQIDWGGHKFSMG